MYIPKDYWMICQRTGIKFRRSEMREERTGTGDLKSLWVHKSVVDPVHPQEYVRVPLEDTSVFPALSDVSQTMGSTVLEATFYSYSDRIIVTDASNINENDPVGIVADNNTTFWTFATNIEASRRALPVC